MSEQQHVLEMKDIGKSYYGTQVLKGIQLAIKPGEIHAIVGENGAGKSTLMNILFGMPVIHSTGGFQGQVFIDGEPVDLMSPQQSMHAGIGMVHQEFMLLPNFTITENIKLNREILKDNLVSRLFGKSMKTLDFPPMNKDARKALDSLDLDIEEYVTVAGLPVGYMQFAEIAREIDKASLKVLVFDEPTAVLTESEAENLLKTMKKIAQQGIAILFITHRLDEVMEISDNITVLRDGELVATKPKDETDLSEIAQLMVGRKIDKKFKRSVKVDKSKIAMKVENFAVEMPGETVENIDLDIYKGEILGLGGLAGQGKIGFANGVMGLHPSSGSVKLGEKELPLNAPDLSIAHGLAFLSEDRRGVGLLLDSSIELNIAITSIHNQNRFIKRLGFFTQIDSKAIRQHALEMIKDLDIRCTGSTQIARRLSGGNQQKVCVARALTLNPNILFVSEPTRGIDIGAKQLVLETLVKLNQELGMTIIMTSSELGELRSICDRIAIITGGRLAGILKPEDSDVDYGLMMAGQKSKKGA